MSRSLGRWGVYAARVVVVVAAAIFLSGCRKTTLDVTLHGGFAYVRADDGTIDVAFPNSVDNKDTGCKVTQFGVDLVVDDGTIVVPKDSNRRFPVTDAIITFDDIGSGAVALTGNGLSSSGSGTMPVQPTPRATEDDWKDTYWVPRTRLNYLDRRMASDWRQKRVSGLVTLAGGSLSGGSPSDGAAVEGIWHFKRERDTQPTFIQAITDRTRYRNQVRRDTIRFTVRNQKTGETTKYEVKPIDDRQSVGLIVVGLHDPDKAVPVAIKVNDRIEDFCTFYELLEPPVPRQDRLMPYFAGKVQTGRSYKGQPSPGAFCNGDFP